MNNIKENDKRLFWSNLCYFVILTLFVFLRLANSLGWLDIGEYEDVLFTFIIQILILFAVPMIFYAFIYKQKPKQIFSGFGFKKVSLKVILCSIAMGIVAFFVIMFVSSFFSVLIQALGYEPYVRYGEKTQMSFWSFLLSLLTVAIMPGFFEEFSHRGMLHTGFSKMGSMRTIVFSGLLFGLMHLNINQFFYAFAVGMLLALVAIITKSIWPSVIIHFMNNGINCYLDFAENRNFFGANFSEFFMFADVNILLRFFIYVLLLFVIVYIGVWLLLKMFALTKQRQFQTFVKEFSGIKDPNQEIDLENAKELLTTYLTQGKNLENNLNSTANQSPIENTAAVPQIIQKQQSEMQSVTPLEKPKIPQKMTLTQLLEVMLPKTKNDSYKPTFKENFFLYCSIFLGTVVTIMTFIWGLF